jgi:serine/tyrosine/threonine adenylyltransferase
VMRAKLGLAGEDEEDGALADDLLARMEGADWTLTFRRLAEAAEGEGVFLAAQGLDLRDWLPRWRDRLDAGSAARIRLANPLYIPRNHRVEEALAAATAGDMAPFEALLAVVTDPFVERAGREGYALPAPEGFGRYRTYCGT